MKYFLILFSMLFSMCTHNKESDKVEIQEKKTSQNVKKLPNLKGIWVNKSYVKSLKKTLSPYESSNYLESINSLVIKPNYDKQIFEVSIVYNTEASNAIIIQENGKWFLKYDLGESFSKSIINFQNNLSFTFLNEQYEFVKTDDTLSDDLELGIRNITNTVLFYDKVFSSECGNDNEQINNIKLNSNGTVDFCNFTSYEINTHFLTDPNPMDKITFKTNSNDYQLFNFKFLDNKLLLYKIIENEDGEFNLELKYTLDY